MLSVALMIVAMLSGVALCLSLVLFSDLIVRQEVY
jgi:hypothetical protein